MLFQINLLGYLSTIVATRKGTCDSDNDDIIRPFKRLHVVIWTWTGRLRSSRSRIHLFHHLIDIELGIICIDGITHLDGQWDTDKLRIWCQIVQRAVVTAGIRNNFPFH